MDNEPAMMGEEDMRRVFRAVRHVERQFAGIQELTTQFPPGPDNGPVTVIIQVLDAETNPPTFGGYYPAKVVSIEQVANTAVSPSWIDVLDAEVLAFDVNGGALTHGARYIAHVYGVFEGKTIVSVEVGEGGPSLDVVTGVCRILDEYGAPTLGLTLQYNRVTFPQGTEIGATYCVTNMTECCPPTWYCTDGGCVEVEFGGTPPEGASGPFQSEADCEAVNAVRWYCVGGVCTEYAACETPPEGAAGPYVTEAGCESAGCEDTSTTTINCCPDPVRKTLWATVPGIGSFLLVWNGLSTWQSGTLNYPGCVGGDAGGGFFFNMECVDEGGGVYKWYGNTNGQTNVYDSGQCDPFEWVFTMNLFLTSTGPCQATSYTVTVTE